MLRRSIIPSPNVATTTTSTSALLLTATTTSLLSSAYRTFILPKQLKAYGGEFTAPNKTARSTFLVPHQELRSLRSVAGLDKRYLPSTSVAIAEHSDSFEDMPGLSPEVQLALKELGVEVPSPVQQQAIPAVLAAGESTRGPGSMLLAAPHGAGKTYAYLAPLFARLQKDRDVYNIPLREHRPRAIIFAPTRELISQIHHVCKTFEKHTGLKSVSFVSTKSNHKKWREMMKNTMPDILILGPSMALRQVENRRLFLDDLRCVVMDEADELVSTTSSFLGARFMNKVMRRLCYRHLWPVNTQTLFVTSGLTNELAGFLKNKQGRALPSVFSPGMHSPTKTSRHKFLQVDKERHKMDFLRRVLLRAGFDPDPNIAEGGINYIVEDNEKSPKKSLAVSSSSTGNNNNNNNTYTDAKKKFNDRHHHNTHHSQQQQRKSSSMMKENNNNNNNNDIAKNDSTTEQQQQEEDLMANFIKDKQNVMMNAEEEEEEANPHHPFASLSPEEQEQVQTEMEEADDFFDYFMRNGKHPRYHPQNPNNINREDKLIKLNWEHKQTTPAPFLNQYEDNDSESYKRVKAHNTNKKVIVFFNSIDKCTAIHYRLKSLGFNVTMMHASLPYAVRDANFKKWVTGEIPILCATDLAARGLDVDVSCVVNFDMPHDAKPYLNRAGRTARMGRPGAVVSLYVKKQEVIVSAMKGFLKHDLPMQSVSNVWQHMQQPSYSQFREIRKNKLAKKFVAMITRKTIPAHLEKTYIRHNATWRPLFRPDKIEQNFGVPVRQQEKITAKVKEMAIWHRRMRLQKNKAKGGKGSAKFGKSGTHISGSGHRSQGGLDTLDGGDDPQAFLSKHSDKFGGGPIGPPREPPK